MDDMNNEVVADSEAIVAAKAAFFACDFGEQVKVLRAAGEALPSKFDEGLAGLSNPPPTEVLEQIRGLCVAVEDACVALADSLPPLP